MTGPKIVFIPLIIVMIVWAVSIAWLTRQAASGEVLVLPDRAGHVERIDAAIVEAEAVMTSNRR